MIRLSREIRCSLAPSGSANRNSWAGWPVTESLTPFLILRCVVKGTPNPQTGYLCDIKVLDDLLRNIVLNELVPEQPPHQPYLSLLAKTYSKAIQAWESPAEIEEISLALSPFHSYKIQTKAPDMVIMTQQFEFSAAHRLHNPTLSEEQNRKIYGKCNNPNGHGHNYVVEVSISRNLPVDTPDPFDIHAFQETVNRLVIDRLDHKHLNVDDEYFTDVVPSVENIAVAIWNWLDNTIEKAKLCNIRVYETPKTWAEYSGG